MLLGPGCQNEKKAAPKPGATAAKSSAAQATAKPDEPESPDLAGTYDYAIENQTVTGQCPVGKEDSGKLEIKKSPKGYTLVFLTGRTCQPQSMCTFEGQLKGKTLSLANGDQVDDEGGKAKNALELERSSPTTLKGKGTSEYQHPQGFRCGWKYEVTLTRAK